MKIITSKNEIRPTIENLIYIYNNNGLQSFIKNVKIEILQKKIRYPLLEYVALEFYKSIPYNAQVLVADKIIALKENGSDVIVGKILQLRLDKNFEQTIDKATGYIIFGSNWLTCDTIGERVFGVSLLTNPLLTISILKILAAHSCKWIVRAVGVSVHYAVKKGLEKKYVEEMFLLLTTLATTTDFHTKKGIGWAVKTVAKFHPDIINKHQEYVNNNHEIRAWFKSKITIGLSRSFKYANKYNS